MSSKFTSPVKDVVFGSFNIEKRLWPEDRLKITWISLATYDVDDMTKIIIKAIQDQRHPKNILVQCFQRHLGEVDVQKIIGLMNKIADEAAKQKQNRVAFATSWFTPNKADVWGCFSIFNKECHLLNEELGVARVNLHKCLMIQVSDTDLSLMIKGPMFTGFQLGINLGDFLSTEGIERVKTCLIRVFDHSFQRDPNRPRSRNYNTKLPPSLAYTPGYQEDRFMMQLLAEKKIIQARPRSTASSHSRLRCSDDRLPGWRNWDIFVQHGPLWNYDSRRGILEAARDTMNKSNNIPEWVCESWEDNDDSMELEVAKDRDDGDETDYDDDVFNATASAGEKPKNSKNKRQKENCKNCNESEKLLELARTNVKDSERQLKVALEKIQSYKKDIDNKNALLAKERAATKHWKAMSEQKRAEYEHLLDELHNLKVEYNKSKVKKIK